MIAKIMTNSTMCRLAPMRIELEDGIPMCTLSNGDTFRLSDCALREIASNYWHDLAGRRLADKNKAPANPTTPAAIYAFLGLS